MLNSGGANCFTGHASASRPRTRPPRGGRAARRQRRRRARVLDRADRHRRRGLPRQGARRASTQAIAALDRRRRRASPREAIMTTDTRAEDGRRAAATAGRSAAWRRARACSRPASPPCSSCITTDAVARRRRRGCRAARRDRAHVRPPRLRRLHVDQRPGHAARERRVAGSRPTSTSSPRRSTEVCAELAAAAAGRCRGREPRHHDRGRAARRPRTTPSRSAARSPATTSSRRRSSATTRTGAGCSRRSARRRRAVRPLRRRRLR